MAANLSAPPECKYVSLIEPGDGDIQICVNGTCFETHRYLLKRFQGLKLHLDEQPVEISIQCKDVLADEFYGMFKLLYA
ncbi:unnamed protein product, partial [Rhizoctonia solani]